MIAYGAISMDLCGLRASMLQAHFGWLLLMEQPKLGTYNSHVGGVSLSE